MSVVILPSGGGGITGPVFQVAGYVFTDLTNLKILQFSFTGNSFSTPRIAGSSSGYQVTAGKTLNVLALKVVDPVAVAMNIAYADNDTGLVTNTTPTNPVYMGTLSTTNNAQLTTAASPFFNELSLSFNVPATKFPFVFISGGTVVGFIYGYEV